MIALNYNFAHAFEGKVLLRKIDPGIVPVGHLQFDSKGLHDFAIPLDIQEDGRYQVTLDWEFEGRNFFHQSDILISSGKLVEEKA